MDTRKILVLERSEDLAEQVRAIVADLDEDVEVVTCTRTGSVEHVQEHDGPFDVLIAGPSLASKAGLRRLALIHKEDPTTSIVIAFASRPDASLREIVQVGADDLLEMPTDSLALKAVLRRSLDLAARSGRGPAPRVHEHAVAETATAHPRAGRVFTVTSPTGGCGKTFYATNMAHFIAQHTKARVAIVDIDLQFGEVTTALRLQPQHTIYDVLRSDENDDFDLATHIEEFLVQYNEEFWVLTAPREPSHADRITPVEVTRVIEALRPKFDYVIVDTPAALAETVLAAFDLSEHLFVMATLDLPSVRNLGLFLQTLAKLRIAADNVSLILNKVESDVGIDVDQIVKLFPQGFRSTLPYAKEVSRSINFGKPVLAAYPTAEISTKMAAGMLELLPEADRARADIAPAAQHASRFGRLFFKRPKAERPTVEAAGGAR